MFLTGHKAKANVARSPAVHAPTMTSYHLTMILALLADVPSKDAVSAAHSYFALTDENGHKLGDVVINILDSFKSASSVAALALRSGLELDCDIAKTAKYTHAMIDDVRDAMEANEKNREPRNNSRTDGAPPCQVIEAVD